MLLGVFGTNVEAGKVSRMSITVAQWGQRKPVIGAAGDRVPGDGSDWE